MEPLEVPLWVLYAVPTPLTVVLFTKAALPRLGAFAAVARALREAFTTPRGRRMVALIAAFLLLNSVQAWIDPSVTEALGWNFTPSLHAFEGEWVERVQAPIRDSWPIVAFLTWTYVCAYVAILLTPPVVWAAVERRDAVREHAMGFTANYLLALPFYFLFPVDEVAWSGLSEAAPLMERVFRGISDQMRYASALDNCFPSLHVACSVTTALLCHRHGPAGLRWLGWTIAVLTIWAVMALGVHWVLDVAAGIPFGAMNALLGIALARRFAPRR